MQSASGTSFSFQVGAATGTKNQININIEGMGSKNLGPCSVLAKQNVPQMPLRKQPMMRLVTTETAAIADVATKCSAENYR